MNKKYIEKLHDMLKNDIEPDIEDLYLADIEVKANKYDKLQEKLDKINEYVTNFSVDKNFSFPLMKKWEENQVKSSIEYQFNETLKKDIQKIINEEE